jgi:hypothetical protein
MVNQNILEKSSAHAFFREKMQKVEPSEKFSERLNKQVLEKYITYEPNNSMKTNLSALLSNKRAMFFSLTFVVVTIALVSGAMLLTKQTKFDSNKKIAGEVAYYEGVVMYKTASTDWAVATSSTVLNEGDSLKVDGEGRAILNLDDGSSIRLNNNSQVTLSSMDPNNTIIANDQGESYARVIEADREFTITAGEIKFESLGTAYKTVNTTEEKGVEVYQSKVSVKGAEDKDIVVDEGKKYYVKTKKTENEKKSVDIDIDEIKADKFVLWNKEKDEANAEYKSSLGFLSDFTAPALNVTSPTNGGTTSADKVAVTGTVEVGARVFVNSIETPNYNGQFSQEIGLSVGANAIKVKAMDASGNKTYVDLTITREGTADSTPVQIPPSAGAGISITAVYGDVGKFKVMWDVSNLDVSGGFKVVYNTGGSPVYPNDNPNYVDGSMRKHTVTGLGAGTYYVRVCRYTGSGCDSYSNQVSVNVSAAPAPIAPLSSLVLNSAGAGAVTWTPSHQPQEGYKLVWSTTTGPVYPGNNASFYEPHKTSGDITWSGATAGGTYYVRICEYRGGACGIYSNEVVINL